MTDGWDEVEGREATTPVEPVEPVETELSTSSLSGEIVGSHESQSPPETSRPSKRMRLVSAAVAIVVLGAAAGIVAVATSSNRLTDRQLVSAAVQETMSRRSAQVVFGGEVTAAGKTIPITGSGGVVFGHGGGFVASVDEKLAGHLLRYGETALGSRLYYTVFANGVNEVAALVPGKRWVELPALAMESSVAGSFNPVAELQLLTKRGYNVRRLGAGRADGVPVTNYHVTISRAEIRKNLSEELKSQPASVRSLVGKTANSLSGVALTLSVDRSNLLRRETIDMNIAGASGQVTMTFERYGTPVSLQKPSPGSVISFAQFVRAAEKTASSAAGAGANS